MMCFNKRFLLLAFVTTFMSQFTFGDNWLTPLSDDILVRSLSIPGTHDSATGDGSLSLIGKTQELTLDELWNCGVRAFDLRPTVKKDGNSHVLHIYHGILSTNTRFDDALRLLRDKLTENPGEFAIVFMRHESDANSSLQHLWPQLMGECLSSDEFCNCLVQFRKNLTLGDVRGKILVMSRNDYDGGPVGGYIRNWSHSDSFTEQKNVTFNQSGAEWERAIVQDFYECTKGTIESKKAAITKLLDESARLNGSRWIVNHTSGYTSSPFTSGIQDCAQTTNNLVVDYLSDGQNCGSTGIVMMDFAGVDKSGVYDVKGLELTKAVIEQNSKYIHLTTSIQDIENSCENFQVDGSTIRCRGRIEVCSLDGTLIAEGNDIVNVPLRGIFIARMPKTVVKMVIK